MRIYVVTTPRSAPSYHGTIRDAHIVAKEHVKDGDEDWRDIRIEECEYATNKAGVLRILNSYPTPEVVRSFEFKSPRLGLEEAKEETK